MDGGDRHRIIYRCGNRVIISNIDDSEVMEGSRKTRDELQVEVVTTDSSYQIRMRW